MIIISGLVVVDLSLCLPLRLFYFRHHLGLAAVSLSLASLGSPCVSVRLRVLGGWVGILLGSLRFEKLPWTNFLQQILETVAAEVLCG